MKSPNFLRPDFLPIPASRNSRADWSDNLESMAHNLALYGNHDRLQCRLPEAVLRRRRGAGCQGRFVRLHPWTLGNGGSWDMMEVLPISNEMLAERYRHLGTPWNCRSMPLSPADRDYMFLLYFSMQGLVARVRKAEAALLAEPAVPDGWKLVPDASHMTDEQAEAIAERAKCCGGIAYDIYRALLDASPMGCLAQLEENETQTDLLLTGEIEP